MNDRHNLASLLHRARTGDRSALEELLAKIRPYLHLLVRQQLEPDQRHKLGDSDIVQETLLLIHRKLAPADPEAGGRFRGEGPPEFLAWVSQIVRNVIGDMERRGRAKKRNEGHKVDAGFLAELSQGSSPEQTVERAERAVQVAAALERLPGHQREALEWRVFERLSYAEISTRTGRSEGALRVLVARALNALRADDGLRMLMEAS